MAGVKGKGGWSKKAHISYDDLRDVSKTWLLQRMRSDKTAEEVKDKVAIAVVSKDLPSTVKHEGGVTVNHVALREKALAKLSELF